MKCINLIAIAPVLLGRSLAQTTGQIERKLAIDPLAVFNKVKEKADENGSDGGNIVEQAQQKLSDAGFDATSTETAKEAATEAIAQVQQNEQVANVVNEAQEHASTLSVTEAVEQAQQNEQLADAVNGVKETINDPLATAVVEQAQTKTEELSNMNTQDAINQAKTDFTQGVEQNKDAINQAKTDFSQGVEQNKDTINQAKTDFTDNMDQVATNNQDMVQQVQAKAGDLTATNAEDIVTQAKTQADTITSTAKAIDLGPLNVDLDPMETATMIRDWGEDALEDPLNPFKWQQGLYQELQDLQEAFYDTTSQLIGVGDKKYDLSDVEPFDVFSDSTTINSNGVSRSVPEPNVYRKVDGEETILVFKDLAGDISRVLVRTLSKVTFVDLVAVSKNKFITIYPDMLDKGRLNLKYTSKSTSVDGKSVSESSNPLDKFQFKLPGVGNRKLREARAVKSEPDVVENEGSNQEERELQEWTTVKVAIAYDTSFCAAHGGTDSGAINEIENIMAQAAVAYEQIFVNLEVSHIEGYCDLSVDPFADMVTLNLSGCGNTGLLQEFKAWWNTNRADVDKNLAHLFSGTELECVGFGQCVVGCGYTGVLIRPVFGYAVSHVTFTENANLRTVLIAHETGHNFAAEHDGTAKSAETGEKQRFHPANALERSQNTCENAYIMNAQINDAKGGFSEESVNYIEPALIEFNNMNARK